MFDSCAFSFIKSGMMHTGNPRERAAVAFEISEGAATKGFKYLRLLGGYLPN